MKYCVVPKEPDANMVIAGTQYLIDIPGAPWVTTEVFKAALAARPPLPADIEAAVKLAGFLLRDDLLRAHVANPPTASERQLARALLKCVGNEEEE